MFLWIILEFTISGIEFGFLRFRFNNMQYFFRKHQNQFRMSLILSSTYRYGKRLESLVTIQLYSPVKYLLIRRKNYQFPFVITSLLYTLHAVLYIVKEQIEFIIDKD